MIKKVYYLFLLLGLILSLSSCNKESSPEKTLQEFIDLRFSNPSDVDDLLELSTGKLAETLSSMEGEELDKFLDLKNMSKGNLKILFKSCVNDTCSLTYIIRYSQGSEKPKEFGVEVKKIAELVKVGEDWKLSDINNIKTYIEGRKNIDLNQKSE